MNINASSIASTSSVSHLQQFSAYQTSSDVRVAPADSASALATGSRTVNALTDLALQTSPARQARVEALRQAVQSRQYQLDAAKTAAAIANASF